MFRTEIKTFVWSRSCDQEIYLFTLSVATVTCSLRLNKQELVGETYYLVPENLCCSLVYVLLSGMLCFGKRHMEATVVNDMKDV